MKFLLPLGAVCGLACLTVSVGDEGKGSLKPTPALPVVASKVDQAEAAGENLASRTQELAKAERKGRKSESKPEPVTPVKAESVANFGVEVASLGDGRFTVIRWDLKTGKSWSGIQGVMTELEEIQGHEPVAGAQYQIKLTSTRPGRVGGVRMELGSGKIWHLDERRWIPMLEGK